MRAPTQPIRAVVFDVGETIVDETRAWSRLADRAGVTRLTLGAALGALIERGDDHRLVWGLLGIKRPVVDDAIEEADLYPDAVPTLRALRKAGYLLGLAGNQPAGAEAALWGLDLPVDLVASSARWGVEKPSPEFFGGITRQRLASPHRRSPMSVTGSTMTYCPHGPQACSPSSCGVAPGGTFTPPGLRLGSRMPASRRSPSSRRSSRLCREHHRVAVRLPRPRPPRGRRTVSWSTRALSSHATDTRGRRGP